MKGPVRCIQRALTIAHVLQSHSSQAFEEAKGASWRMNSGTTVERVAVALHRAAAEKEAGQKPKKH